MRVIGINIPDNKRVDIALRYLYGVGPTRAREITRELRLDPAKRARELSAEEVNKIQLFVEKHYQVEGALRQAVRANISRLKDIKAYRGIRHARHLPVRGQRTKTNSRTARGNVRKTAGSGKRKVELK
jgi:small subunit ribosomal protein S13